MRKLNKAQKPAGFIYYPFANAERSSMKKLLFIPLCAVLLSLFALTASAEGRVIYENDFSDSESLSELSVRGKWSVSDGVLRLGSGTSSSGYVIYEIPEEYEGLDYCIEVDFIGHTATGGILIGADGAGLSAVPSYFFGYTASITSDGLSGIFSYFDKTGGWGGNIRRGPEALTEKDLHLSVRTEGDTLKYIITTADGGRQLFGMTYKIASSDEDTVYSSFNRKVGLRKAYVGEGSFDNLKITVYQDDKLPQLTKQAQLCGTGFAVSDGVTVLPETAKGSGALLSVKPLTGEYAAEAQLLCAGKTKLLFGMKDSENGYAFVLDAQDETAALYKIVSGAYECLGKKNTQVAADYRTLRITCAGGVFSLCYDSLLQGDGMFPLFCFTSESTTDGRLGFVLDGGSVKDFSLSDCSGYAGETYTNPVTVGADPDILFYNGTYYLYLREIDGSSVFTVRTSSDLVHWSEGSTVFSWKSEYTAIKSYCMSPNVLYHDGYFYLFYASRTDGTYESRRIYYAVSDSPYGPFTGQTRLHDVTEIGGHPFTDDDGRVYITLSRFDTGGCLWIEELTVSDGVITPMPETAFLAVYPEFEYEIDGRGRVCEGGVLYKHGGRYYLLYATGSYRLDYGEAYAVSDSVFGPYEKYSYNGILTHNSAVAGPGDGVIVPSPDGSELYLVYHRHYDTETVAPRLTCIDKLSFVKNPDGGADIITVNGPSSTAQPVPSDIYRLDPDRSGKTDVRDLFAVISGIVHGGDFCGTYDTDRNGKTDAGDIKTLVLEIIKRIRETQTA